MNPSKCLVILALSAAMAAGSTTAGATAEGSTDTPGAQAPTRTEPAPHAAAVSTTDVHPDESALAGEWRLAETPDEEQERHRAIEEAVREMPAMVQSRARNRLTERSAPPPTLEIEIDGSRLLLTGARDRIELELDGPPVEISARRETTRMSARMDRDALWVEARGSRGGRTTTYEADGAHLTVRTTIRGERLTDAVIFATTYARSE